MSFKFPVPNRSVEIAQFARKHDIKYRVARYHLERMVKAGVMTKKIESFLEEKEYYNPMATHMFVNRAVYRPVEA